ncbi:MAG: saccharopine dehydrogenase [Ignavibacteria bacterium]|nr:MAG: saccharopine dehydrogenase [Ignavibacteria bacterium]
MNSSMKKVVVLGAGQSSPALIKYLLDNSGHYGWFVTVCDRDLELAQKRINGHPNGMAVEFDVTDEAMRHSQIKSADVVINFLAPKFQYLIALDCLNFGKHMISASYEDIRIQDLNKDAVRKGVLILNEMGLDPGIDHMSAMKVIDSVKKKGGKIKSFISYGSGLPAPEVNANPLNYCITWNPRNVVMAGETGAQYMENGKIKILPHYEIFQRTWRVEIENIGVLEAYPNRDSLIYKKIFDLPEVHTMIRGTLRYPGWSETWNQIVKLGLPNENIQIPDLHKKSYAEFTEMFLPLNVSGPKLEQRIANFLNISPTGGIMEKLRWLGLFSNDKIKGKLKTPAEVMTKILKSKMPLPEGARDMVIIAHEIIAEFPNNGGDQKIKSTLVRFGTPNGDTAIAETVGLPAAITAKLLLTNDMPVVGTQIPTNHIIYTKVLKELEELGIKFVEKKYRKKTPIPPKKDTMF